MYLALISPLLVFLSIHLSKLGKGLCFIVSLIDSSLFGSWLLSLEALSSFDVDLLDESEFCFAFTSKDWRVALPCTFVDDWNESFKFLLREFVCILEDDSESVTTRIPVAMSPDLQEIPAIPLHHGISNQIQNAWTLTLRPTTPANHLNTLNIADGIVIGKD